MWALDGRAVTSVRAATKRARSIPHEEWLKFDNSPEDSSTAGDRLRDQLEAANAPRRPEPEPES